MFELKNATPLRYHGRFKPERLLASERSTCVHLDTDVQTERAREKKAGSGARVRFTVDSLTAELLDTGCKLHKRIYILYGKFVQLIRHI